MANVTVYRAVSLLECEDLQRTGHFRSAVNSMEGKHFALISADARAWARRFYVADNFRIVQAEINAAMWEEAIKWDKLDCVGAAWYVDRQQLNRVRFVGVIE